MTDLAHLRRLAISDPSAEAALNRELRRRDLPPEWVSHPAAPPIGCESPQRDRVEGWAWVEGWVAPLAAPGHTGHVWRAFVFDGDAEVGEVAVYLSLAPREQTLCFASTDGRAEPTLRVYRGPGAQWAIESDPRLYAALTHCPASSMVNEIRLGRACYAVPASQMITVTLAPTLAPTHPLYARLAAVPGVEVDAIIEDRPAWHVHVILHRAPSDYRPVWRAIADNLPVGILARGDIWGVVDYEGGHSVRVAFSMSAGTPPA